jgi:hypothetical protein
VGQKKTSKFVLGRFWIGEGGHFFVDMLDGALPLGDYPLPLGVPGGKKLMCVD